MTLKNGVVICDAPGSNLHCLDAYLQKEMGILTTGNKWREVEMPPTPVNCSAQDCEIKSTECVACVECELLYCQNHRKYVGLDQFICPVCDEHKKFLTCLPLVNTAERIDQNFDLRSQQLASDPETYLYCAADVKELRLSRRRHGELMTTFAGRGEKSDIRKEEWARFLSIPAYRQRTKEIHRLRYKMLKAKRDLKICIAKPI